MIIGVFWIVVWVLFLWGLHDLVEEHRRKEKARSAGQKLHQEIDKFLRDRRKHP